MINAAALVFPILNSFGAEKKSTAAKTIVVVKFIGEIVKVEIPTEEITVIPATI